MGHIIKRLKARVVGLHAGPGRPATEVNKERVELGLKPLCYKGYHWPHSMCMEPAVVRTKIADRFEWRYHCKRHSRWPDTDRSNWLTYDGTEVDWDVQRLFNGEWVDWENFPIRTPTEYRQYEDNRDIDSFTFVKLFQETEQQT